MSILKTVVSVANTEEVSELKGDQDPTVIKEQMSAFFPQIANCSFTVKIEGDTKFVTFAERLGTKG